MTGITVIVFDAECVLCSGWVQFLLKRDRRDQFQFASIQSVFGKGLLRQAGLKVSTLDTLLVIEADRVYRDSLAILRILHQLGGLWRLAWIGWLIPSSLRDRVYRYVAINRYAIFGRRDVCFLPDEGQAAKFLD